MRIAMVYGRWLAGGKKYDIAGLYQTAGLTGSESSFFNTARGLAELGHSIDIFCDHTNTMRVRPEITVSQLDAYSDPLGEAVIAWCEPDYLRKAQPGQLRICAQQLNDFDYCQPGYSDHVDLYVVPSASLGRHLGAVANSQVVVIPNSVNLEFYQGPPSTRDPLRVVYCSSPDRGLHHLLEWWPHIRAKVPRATLRIFYRVRQWLEQMQGRADEHGRRARYIAECLRRLGAEGENGIFLIDSVPNTQMAHELGAAALLAYPCDTMGYTEGFGVSVLDALAAGCPALISDCDAFGEVYAGVAQIIPGRPGKQPERWIEAITDVLLHGDPGPQVARQEFAVQHCRQMVAGKWQDVLMRQLAQKAA